LFTWRNNECIIQCWRPVSKEYVINLILQNYYLKGATDGCSLFCGYFCFPNISSKKNFMKKIFTLLTIAFAISISSFAQIANWDFTGQSTGTAPTSTASAADPNLSATPIISRGAAAVASAGNNSFRTTGFQNNGIATTNTDYFQFALSPAVGYKLSISAIDARFAGTSGFAISPGVSNQFAYSLDGSTFTLIGSPSVVIGTPATLPTIATGGIAALQNVPAGTTVTFRYYASGQSTTGGWGFNSPSAGTNGLAVSGTISPAVVAFSSAGDISATKSANKTNLSWNLGCTAARCTYELQRSANSVTFNTINSATVTPAQCAAPFNFTDAQPLSGINYYRVKVIDLDGSSTYSKIVAVRFNGSEPIKVVPTIAVNDVKVFYESATTGTSSWIVYDMTGRAVSKSNVNLMKGQNTITINVANLMKGQYQIIGNTEAGNTDAVKIIKQ
jgi:hypothetical protein